MIHTEIYNFLRDAQHRIGELTEEIDKDYNIGEIESPKSKHKHRLELMAFMEVLYEINWPIEETSYNHVVSHTDDTYYGGWTEQKILDEIEYLRVHCMMVEKPFMTFVPFYTEFVEISEQSSGNVNVIGGNNTIGVPATGNYRQIVMYNASGLPIAIDPSPYGGMEPNETITAYFEGRI